jgi:hypothetical protein
MKSRCEEEIKGRSERLFSEGGKRARLCHTFPRLRPLLNSDRHNVNVKTLVARVNNEFSPYLKENTTLHHYKDQLGNAV